MKAAREISLAVFYIEYQWDSEILEILETGRVNFRKVSGKLPLSTALQGAAFRGAGVEPMCRRARHICLASPRGPSG
ncbi:MAG: hypothetical protein WBE33_09390, partial [Planococcus citreus]